MSPDRWAALVCFLFVLACAAYAAWAHRSPPLYRIEKVGNVYWLSRDGWCQGHFTTLDAAVRERQAHRGWAL